ncbi:hypothetical protein IMCC21224_112698 [Puniceibacterium sp. IMCC21224]|nr:hypothetical protein IMCC21224_112698 [Puniceibacterium sp. IMCC21224]
MNKTSGTSKDAADMDLPRKSSGLSAHVRRPSLESQGTFPAKG